MLRHHTNRRLRTSQFGLLLILLFMLPQTMPAQTSNDSGTVTRLTLPDAIQRALEDNRDIQIAERDLETAEAQISEVYGRAYPQLDGNASYMRNIKTPVMFLPPNTPFNPTSKTQTFEMGSKNSFSAGVSARQALFDSQVNTGIQLAKRYRQYAELSSQAKRELVTRDVKVAFYQALLAQRLVEVSERTLELAQANHSNVKALYENGVAAEFDFLRAEVQLANTSPVVSRNRNNYTIAVDDLKRIIGMEPSAQVIVEGTLDLDTLSKQESPTDEAGGVESNTTVRSLKAMESVMQKNIAIESSAYYPTLSAFGSYDYQAQDNTLDIGDYEWVDSFVAGLTLSVPLFNGFQTKYRVAQAKLGKHRAILNRQQAEDGVRIRLLQAGLRTKEAKERYFALAQSVDQARRAVEISTIRYQNGVGTQLELLDAQTARAQTESEQALAAFEYFSALADWEQLCGTSSTSSR